MHKENKNIYKKKYNFIIINIIIIIISKYEYYL